MNDVYITYLGYKFHLSHKIAGCILAGVFILIASHTSVFLMLPVPVLLSPLFITRTFIAEFNTSRYRVYTDYVIFRTGPWKMFPEAGFIILERKMERETIHSPSAIGMVAAGSFFLNEYEVCFAKNKQEKKMIFTSDLFDHSRDIAFALAEKMKLRVCYIFRKEEKWLN